MKKLLDKKTTISYDTRGTIEKLGNIVSMNKINIDVQKLISTMPYHLDKLTDDEREIFRAYFWRQMCIFDIYNTFEYDSCEDIEQILFLSIDKFINILKTEYGTI